MVWLIEGQDGIERAIDPDRWCFRISSSAEKFTPAEASLTVPRSAPVRLHDWVRAVDGGKTEFLGYVSRQPSLTSGGRKSISSLGVETLLMNCPCPLQSYFAGDVLLSQVFGSDDPDTSAHVYDIPGLIFAANSLIPPGVREDTLPSETTDDWIAHGPSEIVDYNNAIVKYPNMGTRSRIGTAPIFVNGYPYADKASYALMAGGNVAVWRDDDDLYLRHWLSGAAIPGWLNAPVFAKNAFDTRCRFGGIDTDTALDTQLLVDSNITTGEIFFNLAKAFGQYLQFEYYGKLCYLYIVDNFDSLQGGVLSSGDCNSIKYIDNDEIEPDAITGAGHGGNKTRQMQSIFGVSPGGAYIRRVADFPYTFFDKNQVLKQYSGYPLYFENVTPTVHHGMLFERSLAEWLETRQPESVYVSVPQQLQFAVNSNIEFIDDDEQKNLQVNSIQKSDEGECVLSLGKRIKTINDAIHAQRDISSAYTTVKNDFGVVAELTDTESMVDLLYHADSPFETYTHYITTWSYWLNSSAWGFPETYAPPIVSYGMDYYRDNNIRLLLSLKCKAPWDVESFAHGKCHIYIYCKYTSTASLTFIHPLSYIKIDPLDEEIVDWDITPYLPYGDNTNTFSLNVVIFSTDLIHCYKSYNPYPKFNYVSPILATLSLKLVQLGYSAKRKQIRVLKSRCRGLTFS